MTTSTTATKTRRTSSRKTATKGRRGVGATNNTSTTVNKWRITDFNINFNVTEAYYWAMDCLASTTVVERLFTLYKMQEYFDKPFTSVLDGNLLRELLDTLTAQITAIGDLPINEALHDSMRELVALTSAFEKAHKPVNTNPLARYDDAVTAMLTDMDSEIRVMVERSLGNSALIAVLNNVVAQLADSSNTNPDFTPAVPVGDMRTYQNACEYTQTHSSSEYDKPMDVQSAMLLLMREQIPSDEVISTLAHVTGMSEDSLRMFGKLTAQQRVAKYRTHGKLATQTVLAAAGSTLPAASVATPASVFQRMLKVMRALDKARQATVKYMLATSRMDRLGVFPICDANAKELYALAQEMELEFFDELATQQQTAAEAWSRYNISMKVAG